MRNYIEEMNTEAAQATAKAEEIANDPRFSDEHKIEQIDELITDAIKSVESYEQRRVEGLQDEHKKLSLQSRLAPPAPEVAAQFLYVKDMLKSRWSDMDTDQIIADYETALESKDKVAVRIYHDFGSEAIKSTLSTVEGIPSTIPTEYKKLVEKGEQLLFGDGWEDRKQRLHEIEKLLRPAVAGVKPQALVRLSQLHEQYTNARSIMGRRAAKELGW